jgi:pilus assembly protein Flp/PilA
MRYRSRQRCERTPHVFDPERSLGRNNGVGAGVSIISQFLNDETAATAIEHEPIAAGIALAIIAALTGLGSRPNTKSPRSMVHGNNFWRADL